MFEIKYLILIMAGIGFIDLIRDMKSLVPNLKAPSLDAKTEYCRSNHQRLEDH